MRKKIYLQWLCITLLCSSSVAFAALKDNPFVKATHLVNQYLPQAISQMWQSEHLSWRAQLFNARCNNDHQPLKDEINASFVLVHDYIADQSILNGELTDELTKFAVHDTAKLHYLIFTNLYRFGYLRRLEIIQHYHPQVNPRLCEYANQMSRDYPADTGVTLPWKIIDKSAETAWNKDISALRYLNRHFTQAFINHQRKYAHITDAKIYARILDNRTAFAAFDNVVSDYDYQKLFIESLTDNEQQAASISFTVYARKLKKLSDQAYTLATASVLAHIREYYPDVYPDVEHHMRSYIELQLKTIEQSAK